jgi:hypothetical protein
MLRYAPLFSVRNWRLRSQVPYWIDFDAVNRILRSRFIGRVTDDDLREVYRFGQEHVAQLDPLSGITDFSEATAVAFSPQTMRDLARTKPIMADKSRPVIFIAPTPEFFGMARMFELEGGETRPNLRVVHTATEAYRALNVSDPQFSPV